MERSPVLYKRSHTRRPYHWSGSLTSCAVKCQSAHYKNAIQRPPSTEHSAIEHLTLLPVLIHIGFFLKETAFTYNTTQMPLFSSLFWDPRACKSQWVPTLMLTVLVWDRSEYKLVYQKRASWPASISQTSVNCAVLFVSFAMMVGERTEVTPETLQLGSPQLSFLSHFFFT